MQENIYIHLLYILVNKHIIEYRIFYWFVTHKDICEGTQNLQAEGVAGMWGMSNQNTFLSS